VKHQLDHRRLGTEYGGWFIPIDLLEPSSRCYCFGAGEDISFDVELIERFGCQVFTFDPTPRAIAYVRRLMADSPEIQNLHFHDFGAWREDTKMKFFAPRDDAHVSHSILNLQGTADGFEAQCYRLETIMGKLEHDTIDLVKLDIEGAEYAVIDHLIETAVRPKIICVEFDEGPNPQDRAYIQRIRSSVSALLNNGYLLTNVDYWNFTFVWKVLCQ
jgi:FkbM family methyltransferase